MDDLTQRLRQATSYQERELPASGERLLRQLKAGERRPADAPVEHRPSRSSAYPLALVVAVALAVVPRPLPVRTTTATIEVLLNELRASNPPSGQRSQPGYSLEGWYFLTVRE